jgi:pimeloyl-ACP methyl ester carboxylesterase
MEATVIRESCNEQHLRTKASETVVSVCPSGVLEATISVPSVQSSLPPLLALHGISRNAREVDDIFAEAANASGRVVITPNFAADTWPVFQRVTRRIRPDRALLNLLGTLRSLSPTFAVPFDLFGFSGGAQLAHRFAMLYPELIGDIHLGAAGWYTAPDLSGAYPYGIDDTDNQQPWGRRMRSGLPAFLSRNITVYVGDQDIERDKALRCNTQLDHQQGRNRVERARNYIGRINAQQADLALPVTGRLRMLPGCGHSFTECVQRGALADLVCAAR